MPGLSEQHVPHKKLLVVDDQQELRRLIALTLHRRFIMDEACDAQEALAAIDAGRPDALILDAMMPGELDGFGLCERIKRSPELADIHVVLVTALGQEQDIARGQEAGADAYFVKPFSPLALLRHLESVLHPE